MISLYAMFSWFLSKYTCFSIHLPIFRRGKNAQKGKRCFLSVQNVKECMLVWRFIFQCFLVIPWRGQLFVGELDVWCISQLGTDHLLMWKELRMVNPVNFLDMFSVLRGKCYLIHYLHHKSSLIWRHGKHRIITIFWRGTKEQRKEKKKSMLLSHKFIHAGILRRIM